MLCFKINIIHVGFFVCIIEYYHVPLFNNHSKFQPFPSGEVIQEFRRWERGLRHRSLITVEVIIYLHIFFVAGWGGGGGERNFIFRIPFFGLHFFVFQEGGGDVWKENPEIKQSTAEQIVSLTSIILKISTYRCRI